MAAQGGSADLRNKPASEVMDELMNESQEVLRRGAAVTAELNELRRRADEAMDWRVQFRRHPWVAGALAFGVGVLLVRMFSRDDD